MIAALTAGACGGSGKPAAEPVVSHSEPAVPTRCAGEDCCEAIYEKETKCGKGSDDEPEEDFMSACRAAAKAEESKEYVVAAGDCASKSSCEEFDACVMAYDGERRSEKISKEMAAGEFREGGGIRPMAAVGVPECDRFLATLEHYAACPQVPAETVKSTREAVELSMGKRLATLSDPDLSAEARKVAIDGCIQGDQGLRMAMEALGCTLP